MQPPSYDVLATTVRNGLTIDEIEFEVAGQQPSTGYLVRQHPGVARRAVLALHDERTDKGALLPELTALGELGFVGLALDCQAARDAMRRRDALGAIKTMHDAAEQALRLLSDQIDVSGNQLAVLGHGLGGEVAGALAVMNPGVRVVVAVSPLLHRGAFVREADHPLAAGARLHLDAAELTTQVDGLDAYDLTHQMDETRERHWLVQLADDDDRFDASDRREFAFGIPASIRVSDHQSRSALSAPAALRQRVEFVSEMT